MVFFSRVYSVLICVGSLNHSRLLLIYWLSFQISDSSAWPFSFTCCNNNKIATYGNCFHSFIAISCAFISTTTIAITKERLHVHSIFTNVELLFSLKGSNWLAPFDRNFRFSWVAISEWKKNENILNKKKLLGEL